MKLLTAASLGFRYGDHQVLHDVNLELEPGQILAIIGPSGSGKSTLIKCLAGLLDAGTGEIRLNGKLLEGPGRRLVPGYEEIRLVPQDFQLKHRMSVWENIRYELLAYTQEYQRERIATLLELCRLGHVQTQDVALISGGEKQRVAIARALATEPEILLLDEPFSNLDLINKHRLLVALRQVADQTDTAIILITHDARDAMEIADQMLVMSSGHIVKQGQPKALYEQPELQLVANLMGFYNTLTPADMNLIFGEPTDQLRGLWAEDIHLGQGDWQAEVLQVQFSGALTKVLLSISGVQLWAYDVQRFCVAGQHIQVSLDPARLFPLH